jgi:hypothetical protein
MKPSHGAKNVHEGASMGQVAGMMMETMGVLTVEHTSRALREDEVQEGVTKKSGDFEGINFTGQGNCKINHKY